jgi:hypothetical protein
VAPSAAIDPPGPLEIDAGEIELELGRDLCAALDHDVGAPGILQAHGGGQGRVGLQRGRRCRGGLLGALGDQPDQGHAGTDQAR